MNVIEKAKLIEELQHIIYALDHHALSLFETAKYKQRLHDIFELCDEGYFKKQILQYRALTQPDIAADQFARSTPYYFSFRGFFYSDADLENVLYLLPESGWALLYNEQRGWQMWLIPAANRTALISDWSKLAETYHWMQEQQELYQCLTDDEALKAKAAVLKPSQATNTKKKSKVIHPSLDAQAEISEHSEHVTAVNEVRPSQLDAIFNETLQVAEIRFKRAKESQHNLAFSAYQLPEMPESIEYLQCYIAAHTQDKLDQAPIYIAEQLNTHGAFYKYAVFLGFSEEQLQNAIQDFSTEQNIKIGAIKAADWSALTRVWSSLNYLYEYYRGLKDYIWQAEHYYPFIPNYFIHTQKFLTFEEALAEYSTPLLLLKERNKIRIIHGQQRMRLSSHELAYPYLILNRDQGFSWQHIKQVIAQLSHPIDVHDLHEALLASIQS
jgi:hypothetical protein